MATTLAKIENASMIAKNFVSVCISIHLLIPWSYFQFSAVANVLQCSLSHMTPGACMPELPEDAHSEVELLGCGNIRLYEIPPVYFSK